MKIIWNKVTWLSQVVAIVLFVAVFFLGIFLGEKMNVDVVQNQSEVGTDRYFGDESTGDLNFDGIPDSAYLITRDGGGSGTFFYVVAALKTPTGNKLTNAFFVGDRIAPQNTMIKNNELYVNYAERKPGEPMTAQPSVGATLILKVTPDGKLEGLIK